MNNDLESLVEQVKKRFPDAGIEIDVPQDLKGVWWADINLGATEVTVEWRVDSGFGVSARGDDVYGESSDEFYADADSAYDRVHSILLTGIGTVAPEQRSLAQLRASLGVSQVELAERLSVNQASISRVEHRHDMLLNTLRSVVEGLGGKLRIIAAFPDELIELMFEGPKRSR